MIYNATLRDVYVGNNTFLGSKQEISNTVLLDFEPERMKISNVSVQMRLNQTGCLVVSGNKPHEFTDFVNISCPDLYSPIPLARKDSQPYHFCTMCGIPSNAAVKGSKIDIFLNLVTIIVGFVSIT